MVDTVRTDAEILARFADAASDAISPQDIRDMYVTLLARLSTKLGDVDALYLGLTPPANTALPVINVEGAPYPGIKLTAAAGTWTGNPPPTITRQWKADGVPLGTPLTGPTSLEFTPLAPTHVGKVLTLDETGANVRGMLTVTSAPTLPVQAELVADESVGVYRSMVEGAVLYVTPPGTTLIGSPPGLGIRPEGDIYITNRTAFFNSLPFVAATSALSLGFVADPADYYDLLQYQGNMTTWFDSVDQRYLILDELTGQVEEVEDKSDPLRKARSDEYPRDRPYWYRDSKAGVGRPTFGFWPTGDSISGLYFEDRPIWAGLKRFRLSTNTEFNLSYDVWWPDVTAQSYPVMKVLDGSTFLTKLSVVTATCNAATKTMTFRLNGTQVYQATRSDLPFRYDSVSAFVYWAQDLGPGGRASILWHTAFGNRYNLKNGGWRGEIFEAINMIFAQPG